MMKVVYSAGLNGRGGFSLSNNALEALLAAGYNINDEYDSLRLKRDNPDLVKIVESLGEAASDRPHCNLKVAVIDSETFSIRTDRFGVETVVPFNGETNANS